MKKIATLVLLAFTTGLAAQNISADKVKIKTSGYIEIGGYKIYGFSNDPTLADSATIDLVTEAATKAYADTKGRVDSFALLAGDILVAYDAAGAELSRDTIAAGGGGDDWGTDVVNSDGTLTGDGTTGDPLKVDTTVLATAYQVDTAKVNIRSEISALPGPDGDGIYDGNGSIPVGTVTSMTAGFGDRWAVKWSSGNFALGFSEDFGSTDIGYNGATLLSPDEQSYFNAGLDDVTMERIGAGKITMGSLGLLFVDNRGTKVGLEYAADYSANYSSRSLVDKAYVDTEVAGAGDDWGSDVVNSDATLTGNGTIGDPLKVDTTLIATQYHVAQQVSSVSATAELFQATVTGHGLSSADVGKLYNWDGTALDLAIADSDDTLYANVVLYAIEDANTLTLCTHCLVDFLAPHGLSESELAFLSPTTPGAVANFSVAGDSAGYQRVGLVTGDSSLLFTLLDPIVVVDGGGSGGGTDSTIFATVYQVDTAKVNLRDEIANAGDGNGIYSSNDTIPTGREAVMVDNQGESVWLSFFGSNGFSKYDEFPAVGFLAKNAFIGFSSEEEGGSYVPSIESKNTPGTIRQKFSPEGFTGFNSTNGSSYNFSLSASSNGIVFSGVGGNGVGLKYGGDALDSWNWDVTSLVTKAYVDSLSVVATDGNGIYDGSGTVPASTEITLTDIDLPILKTGDAGSVKISIGEDAVTGILRTNSAQIELITSYGTADIGVGEEGFNIDADASVGILTPNGFIVDAAEGLVFNSDSTSFEVQNDLVQIKDNRASPTGITYYADYSETYTARSLVDKGYVDSLVAAGSDGSSIYTTSDTAVADLVVTVSGDFAEFEYDSGNPALILSNEDNTATIYPDESGGITDRISIGPGSFAVQNDSASITLSEVDTATFLLNHGSKQVIKLDTDASKLHVGGTNGNYTLEVEGPAKFDGRVSVRTRTVLGGSQSVNGSDYLIRCSTTVGNLTITLPTPTDNRVLKFKRVDALGNWVKFIGVVDGVTDPQSNAGGSPIISLNAQYGWLEITYNGSSWDVTGSN